MISYRVIPVLLLKGSGLVKTIKFKKEKYVGDPINAVKIFNDKEVDELVFLDIEASKMIKGPNYDLLEQISSECFMPLGYGGGIISMRDVEKILKIGFEKVIFNSAVFLNKKLIEESAKAIGNQSVVVCLDVKSTLTGDKKIFSHSNCKVPKSNIADFAKELQDIGVGEIILNSVDKDGTMSGFDLELLISITKVIDIPVVACGGAGTIQHLWEAIKIGGATAVAAGSLFVFHGPHRAVLINYPTQNQLHGIFRI